MPVLIGVGRDSLSLLFQSLLVACTARETEDVGVGSRILYIYPSYTCWLDVLKICCRELF